MAIILSKCYENIVIPGIWNCHSCHLYIWTSCKPSRSCRQCYDCRYYNESYHTNDFEIQLLAYKATEELACHRSKNCYWSCKQVNTLHTETHKSRQIPFITNSLKVNVWICLWYIKIISRYNLFIFIYILRFGPLMTVFRLSSPVTIDALKLLMLNWLARIFG